MRGYAPISGGRVLSPFANETPKSRDGSVAPAAERSPVRISRQPASQWADLVSDL